MSSRIVFDTNYLISLGTKEYLEGKTPERLRCQIQSAVDRGDIVVIPKTVQIEINAWIKKAADREFETTAQAWSLLEEKGYQISPELPGLQAPIDWGQIVQSEFADVYLLEPSIENYKDAENRASYRLPPLPKKPEDEEFRDRIIWSQLLTLAEQSDLPVVIVSGDKIFKNGADSDEGRKAKVLSLATEDDLNQWLDQRSPFIQSLIDDILIFSDQLKAREIQIQEEDIDRVTDYRSMREKSGSLLKKFSLVASEGSGLPASISGRLIYSEKIPISLSLNIGDEIIEVTRKPGAGDRCDSDFRQQAAQSKRKSMEAELKNMVGD